MVIVGLVLIQRSRTQQLLPLLSSGFNSNGNSNKLLYRDKDIKKDSENYTKMVKIRSTLLSSAIVAISCIASEALVVNKEGLSRREAVAAAFGLAGMVAQAPMALAGSAPPTPDELERVKVGYKQIQYLLDNFDQETTVCRENGGECKRDADAIRRAMGLRSTSDPLFQIDKVFAKVKNMDLDPDKLDAFFEASEDWNSAMNMS